MALENKKKGMGVDFVTDVKKLYFDELPSVLRDLRQYRLLDTERIVYRLYIGEGMVTLGAQAP